MRHTLSDGLIKNFSAMTYGVAGNMHRWLRLQVVYLFSRTTYVCWLDEFVSSAAMRKAQSRVRFLIIQFDASDRQWRIQALADLAAAPPPPLLAYWPGRMLSESVVRSFNNELYKELFFGIFHTL
jgi:hypothetical protein